MINKIIKFLGGYTEEEYTLLKTDIFSYKQIVENLQIQLSNLSISSEEKSILEKYSKYSSLNKFKEYLEQNVPSYPITYGAYQGVIKSNGDTSKLYFNQYCHKFLYLLDNNESDYEKFILNLLNYEYTNADKLIYDLNIAINNKINPAGRYRTDIEAWKIDEYWEASWELYDILVKEKLGLDCDSIAMFKFYCFYVALKYFNLWEENKWRLRLFVTKVITGMKHMALAWVKEGPNNWIPIESTYYPEKFIECWERNITIDNTLIYDVIFSFDFNTEYKKLS